MDFTSVIKEVKAKVDAKNNVYVEMKLDTILCSQIDLEEAKRLVGRAVSVKIERRDLNLPGLEE